MVNIHAMVRDDWLLNKEQSMCDATGWPQGMLEPIMLSSADGQTAAP